MCEPNGRQLPPPLLLPPPTPYRILAPSTTPRKRMILLTPPPPPPSPRPPPSEQAPGQTTRGNEKALILVVMPHLAVTSLFRRLRTGEGRLHLQSGVLHRRLQKQNWHLLQNLHLLLQLQTCVSREVAGGRGGEREGRGSRARYKKERLPNEFARKKDKWDKEERAEETCLKECMGGRLITLCKIKLCSKF